MNLGFLETLTPTRLPATTCDNRTGLLVLARLAESSGRNRTHIMTHTDSFHLSGQSKDDITSYFFSFVY